LNLSSAPPSHQEKPHVALYQEDIPSTSVHLHLETTTSVPLHQENRASVSAQQEDTGSVTALKDSNVPSPSSRGDEPAVSENQVNSGSVPMRAGAVAPVPLHLESCVRANPSSDSTHQKEKPSTSSDLISVLVHQEDRPSMPVYQVGSSVPVHQEDRPSVPVYQVSSGRRHRFLLHPGTHTIEPLEGCVRDTDGEAIRQFESEHDLVRITFRIRTVK
jgi:hypothetical protein